MPTTLTVRAHAKINLSLRVLRRRPDGYHDLHTVFQTLALHDVLTFASRPGPLEIRCTDPTLACDRTNLVWRAAAMLWQHQGKAGDPDGVVVDLDKRIPMKGGLGGGSSDGAAALMALARLWRLELPPSELRALGQKLGADVPFFFVGGTALGLGRGDEIQPLADLPARHALLVIPAFDVSTADAFGWVDLERRSPDVRTSGRPDVDGPGDSRTVGLPDSRTDVFTDLGENDFEPVVAARYPEVREIKRMLLAHGASTAALTGSGSTVFGLFEDEKNPGEAAAALSHSGYRVERTRTISRVEYGLHSGRVLV